MMINRKSGILALWGIFFSAVVASAGDPLVPVPSGEAQDAGVAQVADGNPDGGAFYEPTDGQGYFGGLLHRYAWLGGFGDDCEACGPLWTATADVMALQRTSTGSQMLLYDPLSHSSVLDSSDMNFPFAAGPRVSLTRHDFCGCDIEFNYFSVDSWNATANYPSFATGFAYQSVDHAGLQQLPVVSSSFSERTSIYSGELNVRQQYLDRVALLAGFRWVELYETYESHGTKYDATTFSQTIRAHNHMYGFQVGADVAIYGQDSGFQQYGQNYWVGSQDSPFRVNGYIKAGIFYNFATQNNDFSNPAAIGDYSARGQGIHPTLLTEAGVTGSYHFNDFIALRLGYQFLYTDGVALGARQIGSSDLYDRFATVDFNGSAIYHGLTAGLDITW